MEGILPHPSTQGCQVVITHGNGPQVGHILIRTEAARHQAYDLPLDVCVAQSQGETGYLIQQSLENMLRKSRERPNGCNLLCVGLWWINTILKLLNPSKPVGPYYAKDEVLEVEGAKVGIC